MSWDFHGGLMVKTPLSQAGVMDLISGWGTKIPYGCMVLPKIQIQIYMNVLGIPERH